MLLRNIYTSNLYSSPLPVLGSSLLTEEPVLAAAGSISAVKAETEGQEPSVRAGKLHWSVDSRRETVSSPQHNCMCVRASYGFYSDVIYLGEKFPILVVRYMAKHWLVSKIQVDRSSSILETLLMTGKMSIIHVMMSCHINIRGQRCRATATYTSIIWTV